MSDWVTIVLTGLGSGVVGSVITTYGSQIRERRQARTQAREGIRNIQQILYGTSTQEELIVVLDGFETIAMLAGLPERLTRINRDAVLAYRASVSAHASDGEFLNHHIATETVRLLIDATWHPALKAPYRWWRTRRLYRVMHTGPRPGPRRRDKRRWERETIRKAKRSKVNGSSHRARDTDARSGAGKRHPERP
jgi:hypothetical protein